MLVGERARAFVSVVIDKIEPALRAWPERGGDPQPDELVAFKLLDTIADAFFFGIGAGGNSGELLVKKPAAQAARVRDNAVLIGRMSQLGTPNTVHHMLQILAATAPAEPELCFDLICDALLRPAGLARYEHEALGVTLFVELIGLYLADYRYLFAQDKRRLCLVDCIAVFVEAGWPDARRLLQSLPQLLS